MSTSRPTTRHSLNLSLNPLFLQEAPFDEFPGFGVHDALTEDERIPPEAAEREACGIELGVPSSDGAPVAHVAQGRSRA